MKLTRSSAAGGVAVVLVVGLLAGGLWLSFRPKPLLLEGEIEATEIDVAAKVPGRVATLEVKLGQKVEAGALLFTLESPELLAKLVQARGAQDVAGAQRRKADTGARQEEIRAAEQQWHRAQAAAELADSTLGRVDRLFRDGVVPRQRRDEAEAQAKAARAAAASAKAMHEMALAGAREEDRAAAAGVAAQAGGAVSEVEAYLAETQLKAPRAGEVSSLLLDAGEIAPAGFPVLSLVDLNDSWVVFQIREDLLAGIGIGTELTGRVPALGNHEVTFKVDYLAALGAFATWRATSTSAGFDLKTFEVRARPVTPTPGLRPGMSVIVPWKR
ncbi:efflux RND transporter periplasmic adaptor subunit [Opitutus sp. ER46]|uniref:HlyD family secretion protein n=1 Tax=Opitutus sp. ER46 TaxID=2161864 RepID=UPI000D30AF35|nr:efflux RND transporter periplasmic adaptor subunit [Opitutus sp. ER46]PTY00519.1 hemolysin secretion protein D [Opitutus sp. ER46]